MNLLLIMCLYFFCYDNASATQLPPGKSSAATKVNPNPTTLAPTVEFGTSPPLIHTTKSSKLKRSQKINLDCTGWCLNKVKPARRLNLTMDKHLNEKLLKKLYLTKALVENVDSYPIRVDANIFADKEAYFDRDINSARSRDFAKNIVNVPTTVFFPLTGAAIKKAMMDGGNLFLPNTDQPRPFNSIENSPFGFLWTAPVFSNRYFESNPMLHNDMNVTSNRKTNPVLNPKLINSDPYNIDSENSLTSFAVSDDIDKNRRSRGIQLKLGRLINFINGDRKRAKANLVPQINTILGLSNGETILEPAQNSVNDIIAGMKMNSKDSHIFVIGSSKNAQSKIFKWAGQKSRAGKLTNEQDMGVILQGNSKAKDVDLLLKAMVQNYQFGDNTPTYKRAT